MLARVVRGASSSPFAIAALVAVNLVPLAGVLFLGWNVLTLLVLYWIENGIVGAINAMKMARAAGAGPGPIGMARAMMPGAAGCYIPFFLVHYGIFWVVHGVFVFALPMFTGIGGPGLPDPADPAGGVIRGYAGFDPVAVGLGAVGLAVSHLVSYRTNFIGRGEYLRVSVGEQMFAPYGRVVVLHVTILAGGFLVASIGQPVGALAVMVVVKTAIDLLAHLAERRRASARLA